MLLPVSAGQIKFTFIAGGSSCSVLISADNVLVFKVSLSYLDLADEEFDGSRIFMLHINDATVW